MLVYTDFDKKDVRNNAIISVNSDDYTDADFISNAYLDLEKGGIDFDTARIVIENIYGKGVLSRFNNGMFGSNEKYDKGTKRGKRRYNSYHDGK